MPVPRDRLAIQQTIVVALIMTACFFVQYISFIFRVNFDNMASTKEGKFPAPVKTPHERLVGAETADWQAEKSSVTAVQYLLCSNCQPTPTAKCAD